MTPTGPTPAREPHQPGERLDIDAIREEWGYADEAGQREWALEHADDLMAEVERLRAKVGEQAEHLAYHLRDFRPNGDDKITGDLAVDMAAHADRMKARAEVAEAKVRAAHMLADEWERTEAYTCVNPAECSRCLAYQSAVIRLRAALADPTPEVSPDA